MISGSLLVCLTLVSVAVIVTLGPCHCYTGPLSLLHWLPALLYTTLVPSPTPAFFHTECEAIKLSFALSADLCRVPAIARDCQDLACHLLSSRPYPDIPGHGGGVCGVVPDRRGPVEIKITAEFVCGVNQDDCPGSCQTAVKPASQLPSQHTN